MSAGGWRRLDAIINISIMDAASLTIAFVQRARDEDVCFRRLLRKQVLHSSTSDN